MGFPSTCLTVAGKAVVAMPSGRPIGLGSALQRLTGTTVSSEFPGVGDQRLALRSEKFQVRHDLIVHFIAVCSGVVLQQISRPPKT